MKRLLMVLAVVVVFATGATSLYYFASSGTDPAADTSEDQAEGAADGTVPASEEKTEGDGAEEEDTSVPVRTVTVSVGDVSTYITATANLIPENEVQVLAEEGVEGRVIRLLVEEGDRVEAGQLLAVLFQDDERILYNKAELMALNAEQAFQRNERMFKEELVSQEENDKAVMDHRIAQQELAEAKWRLERTEIRAPFGGRLTLRNATLGQHVRPGDSLFTVTDFEPLISRVYLPEKDVLTLTEGREVEIRLNVDEDVTFRGRIRQISPVVDTSTGTVKVTVEAISPPPQVRPGGFVTIDIVRETHADTMTLPREAVIRVLQKAHVFVVKDEVAEKRLVRLGLEQGDHLEILSGLEPDEEVVVAGQGGLKDGDRIKVLAEDDGSTRAAVGTRRRHQG